MNPVEKIWLNGELVDWADATVHIGAHGLHYGTGVFEGIRCYETAAAPRSSVSPITSSVFTPRRSCCGSGCLLGRELRSACLALVAANRLTECYVRPIAFVGAGPLGVRPNGNPVEVGVMCWPWGAYLGEDSLRLGIRAMVSSWRRVGPNTIPHAAKATGIYLNSMLAVDEAVRAGYDEAILLTESGHRRRLRQARLRRQGRRVLLGPVADPSDHPDTIIALAAELGYPVVETQLDARTSPPTRCSCVERPPRSPRCARSTTDSGSGRSRSNAGAYLDVVRTGRARAGGSTRCRQRPGCSVGDKTALA